MSRKWKISISIVLIISIVLGSFYGVSFRKNKSVIAQAATQEYFVGDDGKIKIPVQSDENVGTETNPFFVLEIVPFDNEAFFGYQIDGCEPIDLEKFGFYIGSGKSLPDNGAFITKISADNVGYWEFEEKYKELTDGVPEDYITTKGFKMELDCFGKVTKTIGTGNFKIEGSGDDAKLVYVAEGNGDYTFVPDKVVDAVAIKDNAAKIDERKAACETVAKDAAEYEYYMGKKKVIYSTVHTTFEHKNMFLKYSVGLAYKKNSEGIITNPDGVVNDADKDTVEASIASYHSVVYTVTPQELNNNLELINRANMIVISTKCDAQNAGDIPGWMYKEKYSPAYMNSLGTGNKNVSGATFANDSNPLSWDAVKAIYNRVSDFWNKCPIIIDNQSYQNAFSTASSDGKFTATFADGQTESISLSKASDNNMYKLVLLLTQMKGSVFMQLFADANGKVLDGTNFDNAGNFKGFSKWSPELFYPYEMVKKSDCMNGMSFDQNKLEAVCELNEIMHVMSEGDFLVNKGQDFVIGNGYKFNGGTQMREKFYFNATATQTVLSRTPGLGEEVFEFWDKAINGKKAGVDVSNILYYILHYDSDLNPNRPISGNIRILDIEPTAVFQSKTVLEDKFELMLALSANFDGNVTVDQMSSSEFIGKRIELVSDYDFVFFGSTGTSFENYMMPNYASVSAVIDSNYREEILKRCSFEKDLEGFGVHGSATVSFDKNVNKGDKGGSMHIERKNYNPQAWWGAGLKFDADSTKGREVQVSFSASNSLKVNDRCSVKCSLAYKLPGSDEIKYIQIVTTGNFAGIEVKGGKNSKEERVWKDVNAKVTVPSNATEVEIFFETESGTDEFWIDDVTIKFPQVGNPPATNTGKFIYAHSGATVTLEPKGGSLNYKGMYGYLTGKFDNVNSVSNIEKYFIYSGNDLTKESYDKIVAFAERFKTSDGVIPIIFDNGFFVNDVMNDSNAVGPAIDRNSYIYKLIPTTYSKALYSAAILKTVVSNAEQKVAVKAQRAYLESVIKNILSQRVKLVRLSTTDVYQGPSVLPKDAGYVAATGMSSSDTFSIRVAVEDSSLKTYSVRMYIDNDFDGVYSTTERIEDYEVSLINSDGTLERPVRNGTVQGGKSYVIQRKISGRFGSVNWKIDLVSRINGHEYVVSSIDGFYVIKLAAGKKNERLPILQIIPDAVDSDWDGISVKLPTKADVDSYFSGKASSLPLATQWFIDGVYENVKEGDRYKSRINGLDLEFTRENYVEILKKAKILDEDGRGDFSYSTMSVNKVYAYFCENYKMIVTGFADGYKIAEIGGDRGAAARIISEAIVKFSDDGNSVLYTHDATSFVGGTTTTDKGSHPTQRWSKDMTLATRASFGMDRYNVVLGTGLVSSSVIRNDYPYLPASSDADIGKYNTVSVDGKEYLLAQGYTNGTFTRMVYAEDSNVISKYVEIVNRGPITDYPYHISDVISTSETHNQYYQLAFDRDDDTKINVWCTLAGKADPSINSSINTSKYYEQYYKLTRKDTRNNYYIYNIGNVTYTGVGHSKQNGNNLVDNKANEARAAITKDEVMLFINTFVAAYRPTSEPAGILVTNDDAVRKDKDYFLCVDVDSADVAGVIENSDIVNTYHTTTVSDSIKEDTKEIGFIYSNPTSVDKVSKLVKFEIEDNSTINAANAYYWLTASTKVNDTDVILAIYEIVDGTPKFVDSSLGLKKNKEYYVEVPLKNENTADKAITVTEVEFEVFSRYKVSNKLKESVSKKVKVTISPRGLFDLD